MPDESTQEHVSHCILTVYIFVIIITVLSVISQMITHITCDDLSHISMSIVIKLFNSKLFDSVQKLQSHAL